MQVINSCVECPFCGNKEAVSYFRKKVIRCPNGPSGLFDIQVLLKISTCEECDTDFTSLEHEKWNQAVLDLYGQEEPEEMTYRDVDHPVAPMTYDANSIRVLTEHQAADRFGFAKVRELSVRYPWVTEDAISRLVEATELSGWDIDKAEARYLSRESAEVPPPEFRAIYRELAAKSVDRG